MDTRLDAERLQELSELFLDESFRHSDPLALEEYFADPSQHGYLRALWEETSPLAGVAADMFPGVQLVDVVNRTPYFIVCRGLTPPGETVCVKFPCRSHRLARHWLVIEEALQNEIDVLHALETIAAASDTLPSLLASGCVPVTPYGQNLPYLVSRYLPGLRPFHEMIAPNESVLVDRFLSVCRIVAELHTRGITHGDLPGNLFLNTRGQAVLLDFNAASRKAGWWPTHRRTFGPPIAGAIEEARYPSRQLTPAFDVYCLAVMLRDALEDLPQHDADVGEEGAEFPGVHELLHACLAPEPELRLPTALALGVALEKVQAGERWDWRPPAAAYMTYFCKRSPWTVAGLGAGLGLLCVLLVSFAIYSISLGRSYREIEQAYQDGNKSRLALLEVTVAQERKVDSPVHRELRKGLFQELQAVLRSQAIPEEMQFQTLELCLALAEANNEVGGYLETEAVADECIAILVQRSPLTPALQILLCEFQTLSAGSGFNASDDREARRKAHQLACSAAKRFLEVSRNEHTYEETLRLLRAGHRVLRNGLYHQREEAEGRVARSELAAEVCFRLDALCQSQPPTPEAKVLEAEILVSEAWAIYKGMFREGMPAITTPDAIEHFSGAIAILDELLQGDSNIALRDAAEETRARAQAGLCQAYQNLNRHEDAIPFGRQALAYFKSRHAAEPGSLVAQRRYISAAWVYADIFLSRLYAGWPLTQDQDGFRQSVAEREQLVAVCRRQLGRNHGAASELDYAVNAIRTAVGYLLLGDEDDAERVLLAMEHDIGFLQPGVQHGTGEDLLLCMLFLAKRFPDSAVYTKRLDESLAYTLETQRRLTSERPVTAEWARFTLQSLSLDAVRPTIQLADYDAIIEDLSRWAVEEAASPSPVDSPTQEERF